MKPVHILCVILSVFAVTSVYADNTIPKTEREKLASAVSKVFGAGVSPDSIRMTTLPGIYEARLPSGPVFVSKDASWVVQGNLVDVAKRESLTETAILDMQKIIFSAVPLDNAVKFVRGNGSRKLITFEDPNCGYCKKFAAELDHWKDSMV